MAYVLSSVSGNLISAASAGYAPTNSADVSAIASAYQVVSSTATQLYAGTAYLTSVNEAPVSAARAGQAANASLATSAYYDGTGRLISSLPDSDTVSAIASSYAESAASSKQDTLTFGYNAEDKISGINGSALAGEGGGGGSTVSTGEFLGYTVVSADNGISILGNSSVVSSSVHIPYTDTIWESNTISSNGNASQFAIYNFSKTAGNMPSLPTGQSVRVLVTARGAHDNVYSDDQIHLIMYTGTNSGSPVGNWQVQNVQGYRSAIWDKTVTWNSTNEPKFLITAENYQTYTFTTTAKYSAAGVGESSQESSYTADILAASPSYVSSIVSSKADSSALSSYALSSDVSGTVNLVSTQSANWGGSALALSAGPGVKLEKSGNVLIASTDETVLFSAGSTAGSNVQTFTLSEPYGNFDRIKMYYRINDGDAGSTECLTTNSHFDAITWAGYGPSATATRIAKALRYYFTAGNQISAAPSAILFNGSILNEGYNTFYVQRIVGINRTAEA